MNIVERSSDAVALYGHHMAYLRKTHPHLTASANAAMRYIVDPIETKLGKRLSAARVNLTAGTQVNYVNWEASADQPQPHHEVVGLYSGQFVWVMETIVHHLESAAYHGNYHQGVFEEIDLLRYIGAWLSTLQHIEAYATAPCDVFQFQIRMVGIVNELYHDDITEQGFGAKNPVWDKLRDPLALA